MPEEEMDIQKLAEYALTFFESKTRGEGEDAERIYVPALRHPTWIKDMMFAIHEDGRWFPDDFKYQYTVDALDYLAEGNDPEDPQFEADPYTSDLIKWLGSHNLRTVYVDDAVKDYGWSEDAGIEGALASGQVKEKDEIFRMVVDALKERLDDIEAGIEEEFRDKKEKGGGKGGVLDWEPR